MKSFPQNSQTWMKRRVSKDARAGQVSRIVIGKNIFWKREVHTCTFSSFNVEIKTKQTAEA